MVRINEQCQLLNTVCLVDPLLLHKSQLEQGFVTFIGS